MVNETVMKIEILRYNQKKIKNLIYGLMTSLMTVKLLLDALGYIKDKLEPELHYRWSCRMAICSSCGIVVNNKPKLACKTFYVTTAVI